MSRIRTVGLRTAMAALLGITACDSSELSAPPSPRLDVQSQGVTEHQTEATELNFK